MASTCFTQLEVWKMSHGLTLDIYRLVRTFPREERYELASQMRRAALSVPANIAEGFGRMSSRDKARFYVISKGSAEELRYYFMVVRDMACLKEVEPFLARLDSVCRMLRRLIDVTVSRA